MSEVTVIADFPDDAWIDVRKFLAVQSRNDLIIKAVRNVIPAAELDELGPKLLCSLVLKNAFQHDAAYVAQIAAIRAEFARLSRM